MSNRDHRERPVLIIKSPAVLRKEALELQSIVVDAPAVSYVERELKEAEANGEALEVVVEGDQAQAQAGSLSVAAPQEEKIESEEEGVRRREVERQRDEAGVRRLFAEEKAERDRQFPSYSAGVYSLVTGVGAGFVALINAGPTYCLDEPSGPYWAPCYQQPSLLTAQAATATVSAFVMMAAATHATINMASYCYARSYNPVAPILNLYDRGVDLYDRGVARVSGWLGRGDEGPRIRRPDPFPGRRPDMFSEAESARRVAAQDVVQGEQHAAQPEHAVQMGDGGGAESDVGYVRLS